MPRVCLPGVNDRATKRVVVLIYGPGEVHFMSDGGLESKFDIEEYVRRVDSLDEG